MSEVVFEKRVVSNSSSPNRSIWVAMSTDVDSHRVVDSIKDSAISNLISTPQSKITSVQASESWAQAVERRQKDRKSAFESKILHTKLFGVPPPSSSSTQATLDNPVEAYKWFEVNCRYKLSLDEHLNELKTTIAQAKLFGESANTSRDIVNQLKQDKDGSSDEDDRQRLYIDEEIRKYKSNCDALRVLKVKIENIKLSIEKYRGLITKQFEQWYSFLQTNHKAISFSSIEDGASDIAS